MIAKLLLISTIALALLQPTQAQDTEKASFRFVYRTDRTGGNFLTLSARQSITVSGKLRFRKSRADSGIYKLEGRVLSSRLDAMGNTRFRVIFSDGNGLKLKGTAWQELRLVGSEDSVIGGEYFNLFKGRTNEPRLFNQRAKRLDLEHKAGTVFFD